MIENWIDVFRDIRFFRTGAMWGEQTPYNGRLFAGTVLTRVPMESPNTLRIPNVYGTVTEYDYVYRITQRQHPSYPSFMMVRGANHGRAGGFETFRFGMLSFMWGRLEPNKDKRSFGFAFRFDTENNTTGFPSVVEMKGGYARLKDDVLDGTPALTADYIFATWTDENGSLHRADGPHSIGFKGFQEGWVDGKPFGYDTHNDGPHFVFSGRPEACQMKSDFVQRCRGRGNIDPLKNQFFMNPVDQFEYMTEFSLE